MHSAVNLRKMVFSRQFSGDRRRIVSSLNNVQHKRSILRSFFPVQAVIARAGIFRCSYLSTLFVIFCARLILA